MAKQVPIGAHGEAQHFQVQGRKQRVAHAGHQIDPAHDSICIRIDAEQPMTRGSAIDDRETA